MVSRRRELVLVGGGHAHVQVLRAAARSPFPNTRVTLVVDRPVAVYSGMVPGFVAGQYTAGDLEIDCLPLARRAKARIVMAPALSIDARARSIEVEGRAPIPYDLASLDIGSTVAGLELPGIREHALPTRPIALFVERVDEVVARLRERRGSGPARVLVVGGGAGGVEVAFCLDQRIRDAGLTAEITLLHNRERLMPAYPEAFSAKLDRLSAARGIQARGRVTVHAATADAVELDNGERLACDALVWVTGAAAHPVVPRSDLPQDDRGFVKVRPTLQVMGHDDLFAVGDCAHLAEHPRTPKAGVYAVRQGPYLTANLRARLEARKLRRYVPQADFLTLLNLGNGSALGAKWGLSFEGRWVMRLKDRIDRAFMRRFQVLAADDQVSEEFSHMAMSAAPMLCGGCAAKVGQSVLERVLRRIDAPASGVETPDSVVLGLEAADDAAAWTVPGPSPPGHAPAVIVSSIDAFRAFTDDPWTVGRVAAVNALNDLYATGAEPRVALALVTAPEDAAPEEQEELLFQVLAGARSIFDPLAVALAGGHTTTGPELSVGFSIDGTAPSEAELWRLSNLKSGDALVLTQPLGTGVLFHADALGRARGPWIQEALAAMQRTAAATARVAREAGCRVATDVTGFGLAGHLGEMARASGVSARLELGAIPALPGVRALLAQGLRSTSHEENARARRSIAVPADLSSDLRLELLFDPQTAGGLLLGIEPSRVDALLDALRGAEAPHAARIGEAMARREDGALIEIESGLNRFP